MEAIFSSMQKLQGTLDGHELSRIILSDHLVLCYSLWMSVRKNNEMLREIVRVHFLSLLALNMM